MTTIGISGFLSLAILPHLCQQLSSSLRSSDADAHRSFL
jgi:hypothetical protein